MSNPRACQVQLTGRATLIMFLLISTPVGLIAQDLCADLGDPAGNFVPLSYCIPRSPGDVGEQVNVQIDDVVFTIPDDPENRFDVVVPLDHPITANASRPITYLASLKWPATPVAQDSVQVRELLVNFFPDPASPSSAPLTNVPAGGEAPAHFSWIPDPYDDSQVIGWKTEQQLDDVPAEIGGSVSHYHVTTWGLPVGHGAIFSEQMMGGVVVPEPSMLRLTIPALMLVFVVCLHHVERRVAARSSVRSRRSRAHAG